MKVQLTILFFTVFLLNIDLCARTYKTPVLDNIDYTRSQVFLLRDLFMCTDLIPSDHVQLGIRHVYQCIHKRLITCITSNKEFETINKNNTVGYCGQLQVLTNTMVGITIDIQVLEGHVILLNFLEFKIVWFFQVSCGAHGLTVTDYKLNTLSIFCGKRLPWIMVTFGNRAKIKLQTPTYEDSSLFLFHNLQVLNHIKSFVTQRVIGTGDDISYPLLPIRVVKQFEYSYHIFVNPNKFIKLVFFWNSSHAERDTLSLHDGPGLLAKTLVQFNSNSSTGYYTFKATAFISSIHFLKSTINNTVKLDTFAVNYYEDTSKLCIFGHAGSDYENEEIIYNTSKENVNNFACVMIFLGKGHVEHNPPWYPQFKINYFVYTGPTAFTDDISFQCQYGGIFVFFIENDKPRRMVNICKSVSDYTINSETTIILVVLVWYSGYSHGSLHANIVKHRCSTKYSEFWSLTSSVINVIKIGEGDMLSCQHLICHSLRVNKSITYNFLIGQSTEVVGPAEIIISQMHTLSDYIYTEGNDLCNGDSVMLRANKANNWPLNRQKERVEGLFKIRKKHVAIIHKNTFEFLYSAHISIHMCPSTDSQRLGIALTISSPICEIKSPNPIPTMKMMGNVGVISQKCADYAQVFSSEERAQFFYLPMERPISRVQISVLYKNKCPDTCTQSTVVMQELSADLKKIYEYTANISDTYLMTKLYHRGLRLTFYPTRGTGKCECQLAIAVISQPHQPHANQKGERVMLVGTEKWIFHKKR